MNNNYTINIAKGKLIVYNLEKNSESHEINIKQLEGIYIYEDNSNIKKDEEINKILKTELNFLTEPFNIEYIFECSINQLPLYLLSNKRYKITIDPQYNDTAEWFSEKFCVNKVLSKSENCILVKITSENNNSLSPQPPIIMAIQGVLCNEIEDDEDNSSIMSSGVIDIDEWDLLNKKKKSKKDNSKPKIRLELIPFFSCMELENIIDVINEYRDNISKMQILSSLTEDQIRSFSDNIYFLISKIKVIPNHIFVDFFTKYMLDYNTKKENKNKRKNNSLLELNSKEDDKNFNKNLCLDKDIILQDIYKTPKLKKLNNKEEPFNIFDENSESYEIRYLILKKLLEESSKEIMKQRKKEKESKKEASFNFETGVVHKIKRNVKRASSPAPSDSSTLSTLSVLSLQRKINNKSSTLLHGKNKTLITKKKSKSNSIAKLNKMNLWHLTKKAVANALKIDPTDDKFNSTRTEVYRSCIYILREKMNKE